MKLASASDASYRVRSGDSLWTIARRNNVSVAELRDANSLEALQRLVATAGLGGEPVDLDQGPLLPLDETLAGYEVSAHVLDDLFQNKLAFVALLNFPITTLEERLSQGERWTRRQWAETRLAERFYRVDPGRGLRPGTGLGLAIVKHVVTRHRGEFLVESELGRGSAFGVVLRGVVVKQTPALDFRVDREPCHLRFRTARRRDDEEDEERIRELARLHAAFLAERPRQAVLFHQARGLLMIKKTRVEGLRAVFADYLRRVGRALVVDADAWPEEVLVDFAAALIGGLAGYRSYRIASAMSDSDGTVQEIMMRALPGMMQERLRCA